MIARVGLLGPCLILAGLTVAYGEVILAQVEPIPMPTVNVNWPSVVLSLGMSALGTAGVILPKVLDNRRKLEEAQAEIKRLQEARRRIEAEARAEHARLKLALREAADRVRRLEGRQDEAEAQVQVQGRIVEGVLQRHLSGSGLLPSLPEEPQ